MFDRVVDDQVVVAEREPRSHCHKVSVLQRARTFPFKHIHTETLKGSNETHHHCKNQYLQSETINLSLIQSKVITLIELVSELLMSHSKILSLTPELN